MKFPWVNISLLVILITLTVTGYLGLVNGEAGRAWRLWLHGISAYALIALFVWKSSVIFDAFRRKNRWTRERIAFAIMLILLMLTVMMGLIWTFNGPIHWGGFSLISLHIYVAIPMMLIIVWHVRRMKFIFKVKGAIDRRLFLGTAVAAVAGLILWRTTDIAKAFAGKVGAQRRFTGSYEQGSFTGNFPATSWIFDNPDQIDKTTWHLNVDGAVRQNLSIGYDELLAMPAQTLDVLLDCTSGWYTMQTWQGILLQDVLAQAGLLDTAVSVTVEAVSKYKRRFPLDELENVLLAYNVAGAPLSHGHGAPIRLVSPNRRGYDWVKWVDHIQVNKTSANLQSPLPLR